MSEQRAPIVLAPGDGRRVRARARGATHDFENRGGVPATVFNISVPGEFEQHMPGIVAWFREHPLTRTSW
jgi:hypothetical protein